MSYNIRTIAFFKKQAKKLIKKYPSLKNEIAELGKTLIENPIQGTPLGQNCFKVRLKISSKNKGKSGGVRVITNIHINKETVYLLSIYDKSEQETISNSELDELLKLIDENPDF